MKVLEKHVGVYDGTLGMIKPTEHRIDSHSETRHIRQ